jgi:spermidine synthase
VKGAHWFHHVNGEVLARPNVSLRIDDGRNFLLLTREQFDVITADIIRPNYAGAGNVYSAEYFSLARRALADEGVIVQWIDPANAAQYKLLLRTFLSVFPKATLWADGSLVAGSRSPLYLDPVAMEARLSDPSLREALAILGVSSLESLRSLYRAGPDTLRQFVGPGQLVTDDRPLVEYYLSLPRGHRPVDFSDKGP